MPIYLKIAGVEGPSTYHWASWDGTLSSDHKGWFEVLSLRFFRESVDESNRRVPPSFVFTRTKDSATPRLLALLRDPASVTRRTVDFIYLGGTSENPLQKLGDFSVFGATMASYTTSGDTEVVTFRYEDDNPHNRPPILHTSLLTRPQDWGRIQAAGAFGRGVVA